MADFEREQMLANFQACTQLEDIETCIEVLDQNGWNLMRAIQSVMPPSDVERHEDFASPVGMFANIDQSTSVHSEPIPMSETTVPDSFMPFDPGSASGPYSPEPSTSFGPRSVRYSRMLHFTVEYRDKNIKLNVSDTEHVGKIKELLQDELGIPVGKQELRGWAKSKVDDKKILKDLHLPLENNLFLLTPEIPSPTVVKPSSAMESLTRNYMLQINYRKNGETQEYGLNFPGSKTIREVKDDIFALTNIAPRHQIWSGWPEAAWKDEDESSAGVDIEISDDEEYHDTFPCEEDLFEHEDDNHIKMPENVIDETDALEHFIKEFNDRYGECHPVFYVGTLDDALKEALNTKAKDRKLLAVYLHHDSSILANVFCSQILCKESIVQYLSNNFITWAWDMTNDTNSARFITMATRQFGSVAASQIRCYKPDQLPVLLIISRSRATNEVVDIIPGSVTLDELMMRLIQVSDVFHEQQRADILEEEEREAREMIRQEQDDAYKASLAADRAKAEAMKEEQEKLDKLRQEQEQLKMIEDQKKQMEEERKLARQESAKTKIPEEPPEKTTEPVSKFRIRTPKGETLERRFLASEPVKYLKYYIMSLGYLLEEYKVLTTYPRRDHTMFWWSILCFGGAYYVLVEVYVFFSILCFAGAYCVLVEVDLFSVYLRQISTLEDSKSLEELKLFPQETLIIEERS
ncbi:hypothetical protein KUTeg_015992 [Tegillarca granosa]|uniref:FAS-associated factor 1 n=1 Tax=Tegillarca granosa TaxID=220873 RepID=A0ABQ9ENE2_TEGGR|nr:hypothetical protein KUTeg_015992 [Tegillarca granosa]